MAARRKKADPDVPATDEDVPADDFPRPDSDQFTLEGLLTSEWGFNLTTATPVQRAICRVIDGQPLGDLATHPDVIESFGGIVPEFEPGEKPHIAVIVWAIRGAKSMICSANAICLSQRPFGIPLMPGDSVRVPVVSTEIDTAKATFQHLIGALNSTPFLRSLVVGKPGADHVNLRHPTGREVEIKVVALSRAGSTLVGRWMPGVIFDEAPRMGSDADFIKSLKESFKAVSGRIMPGGTIMMPGSPHKPVGMVFELFEKYYGAPSKYCVVVKATGPLVNPLWWTPEQCAFLEEHDPKLFRRDVLAEFDDGEDSLLPYRAVDAAMKTEAPAGVAAAHTAVLFPASHRNAWTLLAVRSWEANGMQAHAVTIAKEWETVDFKQIRETLRPTGLDTVLVPDGTSLSMTLAAERAGLSAIPCELAAGDNLENALECRALLVSGRLFLPADKTLRGDLIKAQRLATVDGGSVIRFPEDDEGRRCDYAALLIRAIKWAELPPDVADGPEDDMAKAIRKVNEGNARGRSESSLQNILGR